jgi:DNA modification methylase
VAKKEVKLEVSNAQVYFKSSADMSEIPDESVNLIITSPPYWTLKDYENDEQIGLGEQPPGQQQL